MKKQIKITGMHCGHCKARVENALTELGASVSVDLDNGLAELECNENIENDVIKNAVEELGFVVDEIK